MFLSRVMKVALTVAVASMGWPAVASPMGKSLASRATAALEKYVFAHFMVGIVQNYTVDDWMADMALAKAIGIDAFALNCASIDSYTPTQLANAYAAAEQADFKVFISFDFSYWNNGDTAEIASYLQNYSAHPAQMQYNGGAVVSTFIGDSFDWTTVKQEVSHELFAIPNLQDPAEITNNQNGINGAFSWYSWCEDWGNIGEPCEQSQYAPGSWDDKFFADIGSLTYMAPVSPWMFTHFNSKNWVFGSDMLPSARWESILQNPAPLLEIVTWNDYGESHYIGPYSAAHTDDGSSQWAANFPHDAWRNLYAPYIAAYKAGASTPTVTQDELVYWYRSTPKGATCTADSLPMPQYTDAVSDAIFVATLLTAPAELTVTSGNEAPVTVNVGAGIVTTNFTMGVGTQSFSVSRNGVKLFSGDGGMQISDSCATYNFNAYVGSLGGSGSSGSGSSSSTSLPKSTTTTSSNSSSQSSTTKSTAPPTTTTAPTKTTTTTSSNAATTCVTITASSQIFPTNCLHGCDVWRGPPGSDPPDHCDGS